MHIQTQLDLLQDVYYMRSNKIQKGRITGIELNLYAKVEDGSYVVTSNELYNIDGYNYIRENLFTTKELLLTSLKNESN